MPGRPTRLLSPVVLLVLALLMAVPSAAAAPGSMFAGSTAAQTGSANAVAVSAATPRLSWINNEAGAVDRQRTEVLTTPLTNVVSLWRFDGALTDTGPANTTLTLAGSPPFASFQPSQAGFGSALRFDGVDDQLTAPGAPYELDTFTAELWMRTSSIDHAPWPAILYKGTTQGDENLDLFFDSGANTLGAQMSAGGVNFDVATPAGPVVDGQWHHVAVTVGGGNFRLYVDGELADAVTYTGNVDNANGAALLVGQELFSNTQYRGDMDEIRWSNVARTPGEIRGYYRTRAPHYQVMWDSDTGDTGVSQPSCGVAARCADVTYGATGSPRGLQGDGARYYARQKVRLGAAAWSAYSGYDWFETGVAVGGGNASVLGTAQCVQDSASTAFGTLSAGASIVTAQDCGITFGSADSRATLRLYQVDGGGVGMRAAPVNGVVGQWSFNGTLASDAGGSATALRSVAPGDGGFISGRAGNGQAFALDADDYATVPHSGAYDLTTFTIEGWFNKPAVAGGFHEVLASKRTLNDWNWEVGFDNGAVGAKNFHLGMSTSASGPAWDGQVGVNATPYVGTGWHHFAVTVGGGETRLYMDGQLVDTGTYTGTPDTPVSDPAFGRYSVTPAGWFNGSIDDIRIHSVVRTPTEVRSYHDGRVADFRPEIADWSAGASAFGACMRTLSGAAAGPSWAVDADGSCGTSNADAWEGVPGWSSPAALLASTSTAGTTNAEADLRFGLRAPAAAVPGTYAAPLVVEVVAPELVPPVNTAVPTLTPTAPTVGTTVSAAVGTWTGSAPMDYSFSWQRCDVAGANCTTLANTDSSTYVVTKSDVGARLRVLVTARNSVGEATAQSAAATAVPAVGAPSLIYLTGFEHRTMNTLGAGTFSGTTGTAPVIDTAVARTGAASLRVASSFGTVFNTISGSPTVLVARVAVRVDSLPNSSAILNFGTASTRYPRLHTESNGRFSVNFWDTPASTTRAQVQGAAYKRNEWHVVDMRVNVAAATHTIEWSVDGVAQPSTSYNFGAGTTFSSWDLGYDNAVSMSLNLDDFALSTTSADYPIGNGFVLGLEPRSTGGHNVPGSFGASAGTGGPFTPLTAADNVQTPGSSDHIDDWPVAVAGNTGNLNQTNTNGYLIYNLRDANQGRAPNGVRLLGAHREAAAGVNDVRVFPAFGATAAAAAYTGDPNGGAASTYVFGGMAARPGGGAWTAADVDALDLHLDSTDIAPVPWTDALMAEVDFPGAPPVANIGLPTVAPSNPVQLGDVVTGDRGAWSGGTPIGFTQQWLRCNAAGGACAAIGGATASAYSLTALDVGSTLRFQVTATNGTGTPVTAQSAQTAVVSAWTGAAPINVTPPGVGGANLVGSVLFGTVGGWENDPTAYAYRWQRCTPTGIDCEDIAGATAATYTLTAADAGSAVRVRVVASNVAGSGVAFSLGTPRVRTTPTALANLTGFEHGVHSPAGGGVITAPCNAFGPFVDSDVARTGDYSLRFDSTESMLCMDMPSTPSQVHVIRFALRIGQVPTTDASIFDLNNGGGDAQLQLTTAGQLRARAGGAAWSTPATISTDRWYVVDLRYDTTTAAWRLEWELDGVEQASSNFTGAGAATPTTASFTAFGDDAIFYVDDFAHSLTAADYPLGDGRVHGLRPDGRGIDNTPASFSHQDGSAIDALSHQRIDDVPLSTTTDWIRQTAGGGAGHYVTTTFEDTAEPFAANGVRALSALAGSSTTGNLATSRIVRGDGSTAANVHNNASTAFIAPRYFGAMVPPAGGVWDSAQLSLLEARNGFWNGAGAQPQFHGTMLEVDFPEPPGATPPVNVTLPGASGAASRGETLTLHRGSWRGMPERYDYQWLRCDAGGNACVPIVGATSLTYQATTEDIGMRLRAQVTASNAAGSTPAISDPTGVIGGAAPTLSSLTGFEYGTFSVAGGGLANLVVGTAPTVTPGAARTGNYGLLVDDTSNVATQGLNQTVSCSVCVARVAVRIDALPTAQTTLVEFATGSHNGQVIVDPSGQSYGGAGVGSSYPAGPVLSPGRWYVIELRWSIASATQWTLDWAVDGVRQQTAIRPASAGATAAGFVLATNAAAVGTVAYDDVAIDTTTGAFPLGAGRVRALRPAALTNTFGASFLENATATNAGAASWGLLDDEPFGSTTDYVRQAVNNSGQYVTLGFEDTPETAAANGVRGFVAHSGNAAASVGAVQGFYGDNTAAGTIYSGAIATTLEFKAGMLTRPVSGWIKAQVDGLQARVGYRNSANEARFHAVMLEADYPES